MKKIASSLFGIALVTLALAALGGDGCMYDTSKIANCKYSGAGGDCDTASETLVDDLCEGDTYQSAYQYALDCNSASSDWQDCWIACIEQASSCDESCWDNCDGC